jgi:hypothetical protein
MLDTTATEIEAIRAEAERQIKSRQPKDDARAALKLVERLAQALIDDAVEDAGT